MGGGGVFFFNGTATTEIYTLSLHHALPIFVHALLRHGHSSGDRALRRRGPAARRTPSGLSPAPRQNAGRHARPADRKSTRLNSSHANTSYAVFCLKKNLLRPILHCLRPPFR